MRRLLNAPFVLITLLALATIALVALTGCSSPPAGLDLSLRHASQAGLYVVTLEPPVTPAAIGQLHTWQLRVATPDGAPVANARITVDGGMPQHGHGLPTRPRVTATPTDGTYLVEGMKFSMTGWWELRLAIDAAPGADRVVFNTVVDTPAASR